jgi:hypothetical protein
MAVQGVLNYTRNGTGNGVLYTGAGIVNCFLATSGDHVSDDIIVLHDSTNPIASPNPILTVHVDSDYSVEFTRPVQDGIWFGTALSYVITGADCAFQLTVHTIRTP